MLDAPMLPRESKDEILSRRSKFLHEIKCKGVIYITVCIRLIKFVYTIFLGKLNYKNLCEILFDGYINQKRLVQGKIFKRSYLSIYFY